MHFMRDAALTSDGSRVDDGFPTILSHDALWR